MKQEQQEYLNNLFLPLRDEDVDLVIKQLQVWAREKWGEEYEAGDRLVDGIDSWKFHLMHAVVTRDPKQYIKENIE